MKNLLIVAHTPSDNTVRLADSIVTAIEASQLRLSLVFKKPYDTTPQDVLKADAIVLGTTENLGYMAGLTKDFFDRCYYPVLEKKQGLPIVIYIRAGFDGTGTKRALEPILTGLKWQLIQPILVLKGEWQQEFIDKVQELALTLAYGLDAGIY